MSLGENRDLTEKFFQPVINCKNLNDLRKWLKQQPTHEIRTFLDSFNFDYNRDKESVLIQELERRSKNSSNVGKWIDRIFGFITGVLSTLLTTYIIKNFL